MPKTKLPITDEIKPHIAQLLSWIFQTTLNSGGDGTAFLYLRDHSIEQLVESGVLANLPDGWEIIECDVLADAPDGQQIIKNDKYLAIGENQEWVIITDSKSEFEIEIERQRFYDCFVVY